MQFVQVRSGRETCSSYVDGVDIGDMMLLDTNCAVSISAAPRARSTSTTRRLVDTVREWRKRSRARWDLQHLDDYILRDICLTRSDVFREASKPFWRE
jgi:uncharacterized protein YjiS (DUF1127 family)